MKTISPHRLRELQTHEPPPALLDVRTPAEHAELHVPGVHFMPLDRLDGRKLSESAAFAKEKPLYIFCRTGGRATKAAERLEREGFTQCHVVEGGTIGWADAGFPVNRGKRTLMSLERQVRICAGSIVLLGVLLAQFVHPAFIWLSGFVGAGLVFAGMTDWCGMGMLLARMPWNQRG